VLFGDPDVDDAVGELLAHRAQPHGLQHRRGDRDDVVALPGDLQDLLGEHGRPPEPGGHHGQAGLGVDDPDRVEAVRHVVERGLVAAALLGDGVDDHRRLVGPGAGEGELHRHDVVPIHWTDVLDAEVLEQSLGREHVLHALLQPVQRLIRHPARGAATQQGALAPVEGLLVAVGGAQRVEVVGDPAGGGGVGTSVVVDDDHEVAVRSLRDVVERLPRHPSGEGPVTHDHHDVPVAPPAQQVRPGDAVAPAQGGGGVGVLHHVVHRLLA